MTRPGRRPRAYDARQMVLPIAEARRCAHVAGERRRWIRCHRPAQPGSPYCAAHHAACRVTPTPELVRGIEATVAMQLRHIARRCGGY